MKVSRILIPLLLISSFVVQQSCNRQSPTIESSVTLSPVEKADAIISKVFAIEKFPGLAIEVWKEGKTVFSKGYGYSDVENKKPIIPSDSQFRIGSISKPFTTAGLATLYEQRKIDLDVPIETYVPSFPKKTHSVSIRQLAGHLGGIRHYQGMEFMSTDHYPTVTEGLSIFINDELIHEPGTTYSYSSYGWNLISAAMETASGKDFLTFMSDQIFTPNGMKNTIADDNTISIPNKVSFYIKNLLGNTNLAPNVDNSYKWAGGGFLSTVEDMAIFGQAHLDATILKEETIDLWTKSQSTSDGKAINYGIGWRSGLDKKDRSWYGHSGGSVGGSSMLLIFPKEKVIVAMAINLSEAEYGNLPFRIAEQFMQ